MKVIKSIANFRAWRDETQGKRIAFVPTMGNLHAGHLKLVAQARMHADCVITSIFVNPTQFNQAEDFEHYPRTLEADLMALTKVGCDLCFTPSAEEIYPTGSQTSVSVSTLGTTFCGATRPGHFDGVCTVVSVLFHLIQCDVAIFGKKDFQQLAIIKQMVRDLHMPIDIIGVDTVRENNGLAMSSRNHRLTIEQRKEAASIYQGLQAAHTLWQKGIRQVNFIKSAVKSELSPQIQIDYLEVADSQSLQYLEPEIQHSTSATLAIAVFLGEVRLIDHIELPIL
jgi:pantoate--beta-alanine ligase